MHQTIPKTDMKDGKAFIGEGIARIAAEMALCGLEAPGLASDIPANARVSVRVWIDDMPQYYGVWTKKHLFLPIRENGWWPLST